MAGNFQPQMAGMALNQIPNQMMPQMQQQDQTQTMNSIQMYIYTQIQQQTGHIVTGWQASMMLAERFGFAWQVVSQLRLVSMNTAMSSDIVQLCQIGLKFEKNAFESSPDKDTYMNKIRSKMVELQQKRLENAGSAQMAVHNQAQAQRMQAEAQAQMQASQAQQQQGNMLQNGMQGQLSRPGGGQPGQQGFQHLQHQMQLSPVPQQQPQQMPVNINGTPQPNGQVLNQFQMIQQQQQRQLQQQGNARPLAVQLTPQEMNHANQLAQNKLQATSEHEKQIIRMEVQRRFPHIIQQAQASGQDVAFMFMRNQIKTHLQQQKMQKYAVQQQNPGNVGPSSVPMQPQRSGNPNPQQPAPGNPNFDGNYLPNAEMIGQQHQAGMIAQAEGQVVVPASNPPRVNTPQGQGGMPGQPNPPNNLRQTPNQAQQFFNAQQAQGQRLNHAAQSQQAAAAAASAVQNRARNEAVKMQQQLSLQGQRGGLGEMPPQQSPAMPTLNTPLRPPGQQPVHPENPQMNPANFAGGLDPRFNQQNASMQRPAGLGTPVNPTIHFPPNMPPEKRHQLQNLPPEEAAKFMKQWQEANGGNTVMPVNGQGVSRPGQQMPQNVGFVAQAMGNLTNGSGPQQLPPGMDQQQFQAARMAQMQQQQQNLPNIPPQSMQRMDSEAFPRAILNAAQMPQPIPQEVQNWGQLKQWAASSGMPASSLNQLRMMQAMHFKQMAMGRQPGGPQQAQNGQQPPASQAVPPGMQAPVAPMAPMVQQPPPNQVGSMGMPRPSDTEVQRARQALHMQGNPQAAQLSDDHIRMMIMKNRAARGMTLQQQQQQQQQRIRTQMAQMQNPQLQQPQMQHQQHLQQANQHVGAQRGATLFQPVQQTRPGSSQAGMAQQPQPPAESAAPAKRENKTSQINRNEAQNPSPAANSKGLKRSNSDDVVEVPNPNTQNRAMAQQQVRNGQQPHQRNWPTPEQLNAMPPEKRKQLEQMLRQSQQGARYRQIQSEENEDSQRQKLPEIPHTPEQRNLMAKQMMTMATMVKQVSAISEKWFVATGDEERLRKFLRLAKKFQLQFADKELTQLKPTFSIRPDDLTVLGPHMSDMIQHVVSQNPSLMKNKQPTAQLNASNLQQHQRQQQALSQQQKVHHQRSASRNNVPPAPTTSHAPFQFGASAGSPQGNPVYSDKPPATTRDNIQLPKSKKQKMGSANASASTSPQIPKTSSPNSKRQNVAVSKVEPHFKSLACLEQDCGASFASAEELKKHNNDQHIKPFGDPAKYSVDALADALGLDQNGETKAQPAKPQTSGTSAPKMEISLSAQGQTPKIKLDPSAASSSMARQMSAPTGKPKPAQSSPAQPSAGTPGMHTGNKPVQEPQAIDEPWAAAGIDPNLLMNTFEPLSSNNDMWRSISPNDTPESSKDGISEPNSDISERVDLTINLDMFDNGWDAFPGGDVQYNLSALNFDEDVFMGEGGEFTNQEFSWDDVPVPTGPVPDLSSHYMMNTE